MLYRLQQSKRQRVTKRVQGPAQRPVQGPVQGLAQRPVQNPAPRLRVAQVARVALKVVLHIWEEKE